MRTLICLTVVMAVSFLAGQYSIMYAQDMDVMEKNTVKTAETSYYLGCMEQIHNKSICKPMAIDYSRAIEKIRNAVTWGKENVIKGQQ